VENELHQHSSHHRRLTPTPTPLTTTSFDQQQLFLLLLPGDHVVRTLLLVLVLKKLCGSSTFSNEKSYPIRNKK